MTFSTKDINTIAHLARIDLNDEFGQTIAHDLSQIVKMVGEISDVNTAHVSPMAHPLKDTHQRLREDTVTESNHRENLLALAPETEEGLLLVPKMIEET